MQNRYLENGLSARKVTRAIINNSGNFLFERRPETSNYAPNRLQLFGGKVDSEDQTIVQALIRELAEELHIGPEDILSISEVGAELSPDEKWLSYFFVVVLKEIALLNLSQVARLELLDQHKLKIEAGLIVDEANGGDIAFDHGQIILENS